MCRATARYSKDSAGRAVSAAYGTPHLEGTAHPIHCYPIYRGHHPVEKAGCPPCDIFHPCVSGNVHRSAQTSEDGNEWQWRRITVYCWVYAYAWRDKRRVVCSQHWEISTMIEIEDGVSSSMDWGTMAYSNVGYVNLRVSGSRYESELRLRVNLLLDALSATAASATGCAIGKYCTEQSLAVGPRLMAKLPWYADKVLPNLSLFVPAAAFKLVDSVIPEGASSSFIHYCGPSQTGLQPSPLIHPFPSCP